MVGNFILHNKVISGRAVEYNNSRALEGNTNCGWFQGIQNHCSENTVHHFKHIQVQR